MKFVSERKDDASKNKCMKKSSEIKTSFKNISDIIYSQAEDKIQPKEKEEDSRDGDNYQDIQIKAFDRVVWALDDRDKSQNIGVEDDQKHNEGQRIIPYRCDNIEPEERDNGSWAAAPRAIYTERVFNIAGHKLATLLDRRRCKMCVARGEYKECNIENQEGYEHTGSCRKPWFHSLPPLFL